MSSSVYNVNVKFRFCLLTMSANTNCHIQ